MGARAKTLTFAIWGLGWLASLASASAPLASPMDEGGSRAVTAGEKNKYAIQISNDLIYRVFRVDLALLQASWQQKLDKFTTFDASRARLGNKVTAGAAHPALKAAALAQPLHYRRKYKVSLKIDQTDDIRRMQQDPWAIPFALKLKAESRLIQDLPEFRTELYIPLSGKDQMWVKASVPLTGFSDIENSAEGWRLFTRYSNQLGLNTLESGLGRKWIGDWDFRYGYWVEFKDPSRKTGYRHTWSLGKEF